MCPVQTVTYLSGHSERGEALDADEKLTRASNLP